MRFVAPDREAVAERLEAAAAMEVENRATFVAAAEAGPVLVSAAGRAEGSRATAAALACAGADLDRAALLMDLGGRAPRPTLIASEPARRLEERLAAHLPTARVAARGQICCLAAAADADGIAAAAAAVTVARGSLAVVHAAPEIVQETLASERGPRLSAVLLRADLERDRALVALAAHELFAHGLRLAVLKRPLGWIPSRRALFGVLAAGAAGGISVRTLRQLGLSGYCYGVDNEFPAK